MRGDRVLPASLRSLPQYPLVDIVLELVDGYETVIGKIVARIGSTAQPVQHCRREDAAAETVDRDRLLVLGPRRQDVPAGLGKLVDSQTLVIGDRHRSGPGQAAEARVEQIEHLLGLKIAVPFTNIRHADHAGESIGTALAERQIATLSTARQVAGDPVARPVEEEAIVALEQAWELILHQLAHPRIGHLLLGEQMHVVEASLVEEKVLHPDRVLPGGQVVQIIEPADADHQRKAFTVAGTTEILGEHGAPRFAARRLSVDLIDPLAPDLPRQCQNGQDRCEQA